MLARDTGLVVCTVCQNLIFFSPVECSDQCHGLVNNQYGTPGKRSCCNKKRQAINRYRSDEIEQQVKPTFHVGRTPSTAQGILGHGVIDPRDTGKVLGFCLATCREAESRSLQSSNLALHDHKQTVAMKVKTAYCESREIACRIIERLGNWVKPLPFTPKDKHAMHVRSADEALAIGKPTPSESYLNMKKSQGC